MAQHPESGWKKVDPIFHDIFIAAALVLEAGAPGIKESMRVTLANRIALRVMKMSEERAAVTHHSKGEDDGRRTER